VLGWSGGRVVGWSGGRTIPPPLCFIVERVFVDELRGAVETVRTWVAGADPASADGEQAALAVSICCELERLAGAGKVLFARRVEETGAYTASGHRSCAEWLGSVAGERPSKAYRRLQTARRMAEMPKLEQAVVSGEVSGDQADVIAAASALDRGAVGKLLEAARRSSFRELDEKAANVRQAALSAQSQAEQRARVHRGRHLRYWHQDTGGVKGSFFFTDDAWGRCLSVLEPVAEKSFAAARQSGEHESREAYLADAFVTCCIRGGRGGNGGRSGRGGNGGADAEDPLPPATVHVHIDAAALRRGRTQGDECCEIAGVGQVPVATARSLLGDAFVELLVRDGTDVLTITGKNRNIPARLHAAVTARDRHCRWPGCRGSVGLQIHHWGFDYRSGGKTHISNLVTLCKFHHDRCTYHGWRVEADPDSNEFRGIEPEAAPSDELAGRRRRLAGLRADARRSGQPTRATSLSPTPPKGGRRPVRC
jgi:Domain of unknown function (DUF222)